MKDVGTGGFDGFSSITLSKHDEVFWHDGGHSAAVDSPQSLESLVDFVLNGTYKKPQVVPGVPRTLAALAARLPIIASIGLVTLCLLVLWAIAWVLATAQIPFWAMVTVAAVTVLLMVLSLY